MSALPPTASEKATILDLFFAGDALAVMDELNPFLPPDPASIVAGYVIGKENVFGAAEWKKYFGLDVSNPPRLPRSFNIWWFSPDPIEPNKLCCETHLPPILRPPCMTLGRLEKLVKTPLEGLAAQYHIRSFILSLFQSCTTGPYAYWLVLRKDVCARLKTYDQQREFLRSLNAKGADYEEEPSCIDLATALLVRYVVTGERHFQAAMSRVREAGGATYLKDKSIYYPVTVGLFDADGLMINCDQNALAYDAMIGIAALRTF